MKVKVYSLFDLYDQLTALEHLSHKQKRQLTILVSWYEGDTSEAEAAKKLSRLGLIDLTIDNRLGLLEFKEIKFSNYHD